MLEHDGSLYEPIEMRMIRPSKFLTRPPDPKDSEELRSLKDSIRDHGLLQPIIVRPLEQGFEIVAGHRRFAACRSLRWRLIPCKILEFTDKQAYEIQLTENLQRKALDPIEEAMSYRKYVIDFGWGGVSELGRRIGRSEEYVSHRIQLLKLPADVRQKVTTRDLGISQALELTNAGLAGPKTQELAQEIVDNKMTVKQIRQIKNELKQAESFDYSGLEPQEGREQSARGRNTSREALIVKRGVLALRVTLSRLDDLITDASRREEKDMVDLLQFLMDLRKQTHDMIGEALKYKRALR